MCEFMGIIYNPYRVPFTSQMRKQRLTSLTHHSHCMGDPMQWGGLRQENREGKGSSLPSMAKNKGRCVCICVCVYV